ncbi:MAG TPA: MCE family protein [Marmoricola sp.]|jgi:phospholipid/cholesterol/gamma-HCH transport system substrate-binding protein|nr:MCE family protein [Marmoricola sp.]
MATLDARNVQTALAATKLGVFTLISIVVTGTLAAIMGNFGFGGQTEYKALFSTASMLEKGDDVRIAGVSVGEVKDVEIKDRDRALVTFRVKSDVPMTTASRAEIRFLNLVGTRYLSLTQGRQGAARLQPGETIPESRTSPALNLTELFNGFQPLFQALNPDDVNELAMNLVRVLQGEGGTVQSLLGNTASLTNALADRDELIGQVIGNLSTTLGTLDNRHAQLNELVVQLRSWLTNVARDRDAIGDSLQNLSGLSAQVAGLLAESRPLLRDDIAQLRTLMRTLNKPGNQAVLDEVFKRLPVMLERQTRTGTYGSWYNYYLCDFEGKIILPDLGFPGGNDSVPGLKQIQQKLNNLTFHSTAARCDE